MCASSPMACCPNLAARPESLRSQAEGNVAARSKVLQADDRGKLDQLCFIKMVPQFLYKAEHLHDRDVVTHCANGIEHGAESPAHEPFCDSIRYRFGWVSDMRAIIASL